MADKSFGDFPSRNIVKNPLLSTAVTGLSIEDLTHNAVLLPVSLSQEVITRPDQTNKPQTGTLGNAENAVTIPPAGDASSNIFPQNLPPATPLNILDTQNMVKSQNKIENPISTVSKASAKSKDDFDVNEYFARLQGTRYVSAPLNSALKEDKNSNLEATEENLEEINLNEPDKFANVQQSLTADIAQNFSQLPTVLPQMASAVFSSFSNMLQHKKSREPTPEVSSGYQEVQFERPAEPSRVMAPPPKEPPTLPLSIGTSNYRLPPKKKYAQIPGLTSGEAVQKPYQTLTQNLPPANQNIPQYFIPSMPCSNTSEIQNLERQSNLNINTTQDTSLSTDASQNEPTIFVPTFENTQENIQNLQSNEREIHTHDIPAENIKEIRDYVKDTNINIFAQDVSMQPQFPDQDFSRVSTTIPPPPTFSNMPRSDSNTVVGRSVLPPSVARRISSNPPNIKETQLPLMPSLPDNIFVPAPVAFEDRNEGLAILQSNVPLYLSSISSSLLPPAPNINVGTTSISPPSGSFSTLPSHIPSSSLSSIQPLSSTIVSAKNITFEDHSKPLASLPPSIFTPKFSDQYNAMLPSVVSLSNVQNPVPPTVFTPSSLPHSSNLPKSSVSLPIQSSSQILPPPPTFVNPTAETKEFPPILSQSTMGYGSTAELQKAVPEPPKAFGNVNFRMTKKRPQYYSGPIEGIGAISNNVKTVPPISVPVHSTPVGGFQGDLFTPQADLSQVQGTGYVEPAPFDISQPAAPFYSTTTQPQDYNTTFDLSRPTTDSYSEPKQELSGFGLLGSLKSKLSSLDINKIQSSVTTFFDPAYNNMKKETANQPAKIQENITHGQSGHYDQQGQYSQESNFDIFVPNIEQAPLSHSNQSYLYQMQFQNQYNYSQQQQQTQVHDAHNYYQNQGFQGQHNQNQANAVASYFGNASHNYQIPIGPATVNPMVCFNSQSPRQQEILGSDADLQGQQAIQASHETQQYYSAVPAHHSHGNVHHEPKESYSAVPPYVCQDYTPSNIRKISLSDTQTLGARTEKDTKGSLNNATLNITQKDSSAEKSENLSQITDTTTDENVTNTPKQIKDQPGSNVQQFDLNFKQQIQDFKNTVQCSASFIAESILEHKTTEIEEKNSVLDNQMQIKPESETSQDYAPSEDKVAGNKYSDDAIPPEMIKSDIKDVMYKLQTNPIDFFGTFSQAKMTNAFSQLSVDCLPNASKEKQQKSRVITDYSEIPSSINMSSAPLLGLSNMLADKTKELNDLQIEINNINKLATQEPLKRDTIFNQTANESIENEAIENTGELSELNICETCREIEKPEYREKEDDLTTQLIENITSPIVLENPVEVPLTEISESTEERAEFDTSQCEEINHITEETIETIQVQSATELLENEPKALDYGWLTQEVSLAPKNKDDETYPMQQNANKEFSLSVNPNAIGFINNVFENITTNLGAELQAEFKSQEDKVLIVNRQINIPTAPPTEHDTKSEGIDVHSIEQDAKKDFPLFEEYVIEPSDELSNDNIEDDLSKQENSENVQLDSFTSRVDKYKKTGEIEIENKVSPVLNLQKNATSPTVPMASYFDTGNYAVETHYRNSLTSPTTITNMTFSSSNQIRVPPGFEEEFQRRLSIQDSILDKVDPINPVIPDTSTQTRLIFSQTFGTAQIPSAVTTTMSTSAYYSKNISSTVKLPDFISEFMERKHLVEYSPPSLLANLVTKDFEDAPNIEKQKQEPNEKNSDFDTFNFFKKDTTPAVGDNANSENQSEVALPDPSNFFTSNNETVTSSDRNEQGFNRLASYFSSPAKTEHSKSFFELSQSQNHYRQEHEENLTNSKNSSNVLDENTICNLQNIPPGQCLANINLMRDLTSLQNFEPRPEQVVRTVNYFTVEYDNTKFVNCFNRAESDITFFPERTTETPLVLLPTLGTAQLPSATITTMTTSACYSKNYSIAMKQLNCSSVPTSLDTKDFEAASDIKKKIHKTHLKIQEFDINGIKDSETASTDTVLSSNRNEQSLNRFSYCSLSAKADHSKSFIELSQSQNHYRQEQKTSPNKLLDENPVHNLKNIPPDQYLANIDLMHDLTSFQNPEFTPELVVKTVNYFTIEYDNTKYVKEFSKGEPDLKKDDTSDINENIENYEITKDDVTMINIIKKCKHCCDSSLGYDMKNEVLTRFNAKTCMDNSSTGNKENNMESKRINNKDNKTSISITFGNDPQGNETNESGLIATENRTAVEYTPVKHHWFYRVDVEGKSIWRGFSALDSKALEDAFCSPDLNDETVVPTDGGRYDVNVIGRLRFAVYWNDKPSNVRRCSWFYKGTTDARYIPYTEAVAEKLEEEYRRGLTSGEWHRRLALPNNESVVMHSPTVMVHFLQGTINDTFNTPQLFSFGKSVYRNPPKIRVARDQPPKVDHLVLLVHGAGEYRHQKERKQSTNRPVRRGADESEIEDVEPSSIDHLLLLCHGVGSACDMRFRNVEEVVDDFRATSLQLIQSHYRNAYDSGTIGRVEVLPISWHATLHSGETGVDTRLARITLDSIPKLRSFTNDTVLDVLFYTSPVYSQTILNTVCAELNRIYSLFRTRNPNFTGGVSLGGHSLGSVILYDLLCHQESQSSKMPVKNYAVDVAGTGQPSLNYPRLEFSPAALYALGSPIAIFECIRGVDYLGPTFALPTCKNFFNIFHPYDPIAYRIEPLINPELREVKPFLIPHHKGRKRMHLELKDTMARVSADIKQKLVESIKNTWTSMWKTNPPEDPTLERVVEEHLEPLSEENKEDTAPPPTEPSPELLGKLNDGRRIDYVLQEAPFEMINEYLFAMSSHVCYWESEDTMLLMLREIYDSLGVQADSSVPPPNLTVQRTTFTTTNEISASNVLPSTSRGG